MSAKNHSHPETKAPRTLASNRRRALWLGASLALLTACQAAAQTDSVVAGSALAGNSCGSATSITSAPIDGAVYRLHRDGRSGRFYLDGYYD